MNMNADDKERRQIRDAMDRLLAGDPIRSDGKLTIKSLADEADLKRWLLTHRHTDLQDEFRDRVRAQNATPPAMAALHKEIAELKATQKELKATQKRDRAALRDADARAEMHARETWLLAAENDKLRRQIETTAPAPSRRSGTRPDGLTNVHPMSDYRKPPDN